MSDHDLGDLRQLASEVTSDDRIRIAPPADLWSRISMELAVEDSSEDAEATPATLEPPRAIDAGSVGGLVLHEGGFDPLTAEVEEPTVLEQRRLRTAPNVRRQHRRLAAMAGVAAAIALVIGVSIIDRSDPELVAMAVADNGGLAEPYSGEATAFVELAGNEQRLIIDFERPLPDSDPSEVWLIKSDLSDMTSLGLVDDVEFYVIPPGIDVSEYSLVDVSIEPQDGDPTHSGRSILRGELKPI